MLSKCFQCAVLFVFTFDLLTQLPVAGLMSLTRYALRREFAEETLGSKFLSQHFKFNWMQLRVTTGNPGHTCGIASDLA